MARFSLKAAASLVAYLSIPLLWIVGCATQSTVSWRVWIVPGMVLATLATVWWLGRPAAFLGLDRARRWIVAGSLYLVTVLLYGMVGVPFVSSWLWPGELVFMATNGLFPCGV